MREKVCENCVWFVGWAADVGACRRYPPKVMSSGGTMVQNESEFPDVSSRCWCGEFKHKDPVTRELPDVHELMTILHQVSGEWLNADEKAKKGEETS